LQLKHATTGEAAWRLALLLSWARMKEGLFQCKSLSCMFFYMVLMVSEVSSFLLRKRNEAKIKQQESCFRRRNSPGFSLRDTDASNQIALAICFFLHLHLSKGHSLAVLYPFAN